jgi:hypothetical protein
LEDGLAQPWYGRVWLNPPYGPNTKPWIEKMAEHGNGVALVFARTDVAWFHDNVPNATAICFLRKRLCFVSGEGIERQANSHNAAAPSCLIAWGDDNAEALRRMPGLTFDLASQLATA